jgi:hypothetical protein
MGASVFAYLFGVVVHEIGHYLASLALGVPESGIVLHPFDLSHNIYGGDVSQALGTSMRRAVSGAAGPLLNLALAVTVGMVVWRRRSSLGLPFVIWGSVALLQESVGMIIGLVDYPEVGSDWFDVMTAGVPPALIGLLVVALLVAGSLWILLVVPLVGLSAQDAFWRKLLVFLAGIPLFLLAAVVYLMLPGSSNGEPASYVLQNRQIALGASVALVAGLASLHKPLFPFLDRMSHTRVAQVTWRDTLPAVGLCGAVIAFQLAFFN